MVDEENVRAVDPGEGPEGNNASGGPREKEPPAGSGVRDTSTPADGDPVATGDVAPGTEHDGSERPKDHSARKHGRKSLKDALERKEEEVEELARQNESLRHEARDLRDKWLRSAAELENYRKRTRKEWELLQQRTKAEIILDILATVDDFERAFAVAGDRDDDFIRGIRLIYNNLLLSLEKMGVRKIEALEAAFDPAYHMAVAQIERDGADSNHVVEIVQEGYCLGDFVVRPAKVIIAK